MNRADFPSAQKPKKDMSNQQESFEEKLSALNETPDTTHEFDPQDIEKNKVRSDLGITYDMDVLRLIDAFRGYGLYVGSVVLTRFEGQESAIQYQNKLEALGIKVYRHYSIPGYPSNIPLIISDEGYGKNDYIETTHSLVVVTDRKSVV